MPSLLCILGLVPPSTPQEYRLTMRLGCKSVSGCPDPLFPFHSFYSFTQDAATALSCNGTLSIFPRLTNRFAECEKKIQTRRVFLTAPQRRDPTLFYVPISHTPTTKHLWLCQSVATISGPTIWCILLSCSVSAKRVQLG